MSWFFFLRLKRNEKKPLKFLILKERKKKNDLNFKTGRKDLVKLKSLRV